MTYRTIRFEESDGTGVCTFDRADVRNALNEEMVGEIRSLLHDVTAGGTCRSLIFEGAGSSFLAGADIAELRDRRAADALRRINAALFREVEQIAIPTIAAVHGYALGGGLEFALACDLRVVADDAKLGQPEVALGIMPGAGATYRLPRIVGLGRAKELIFTGRMIGGAEALAMGLANRVVPRESVLDEARALATMIAKNGALAVRLAKTALNHAHELSTDAGLALESVSQAVLFDDDEKHERMTRFLERKKEKES
ncbi:MAG: enoyl-CoA hydratase/isomerase family protein [Gemmatimonadetes bacterium]|nr:enoyl-CoA hydratase/isomerase family protein [Gemmatimonadota bacterium]